MSIISGSKILKKNMLSITSVLVFVLFSAMAANAEDKQTYSPYANQKHPRTVLWGETHLHTKHSFDANFFGNTSIGPDEAYRFAKGETIQNSHGESVGIDRPLDFLVIADHAENLGLVGALRNKDPSLLAQPEGRRRAELLNKTSIDAKSRDVNFIKSLLGIDGIGPLNSEIVTKNIWEEISNTSDRYNQPGQFTAFIGYEWSSSLNGNNLHRNVIFRDGSEKTLKISPFSALDSNNPEDLWDFLQGYEDKTGGRVLAIPHNGNLSNGLMFLTRQTSGEPFDNTYVETRARWEPLYEVTQTKGDAETHPVLSPDDNFADYETWDLGNVLGSEEKVPSMLQYEYARSALLLGLKQESLLGINPFKFGVVGSTDSHTGLSSTQENNMLGITAGNEPSADRLTRKTVTPKFDYIGSAFTNSGLAAVWATENTREDIFDAMQRKETYATTGSRIMVRFFGGWDFANDDDLRPDYDLIGYQKGVPMGGDLYFSSDSKKAPQFLVVASKDPTGANLDRIQMVKGWLNTDGTTGEKVYNVSVSDDRKIKNNKVKPLKSNVDIKTATYTNNIGEVQLSTVWQDPEFDPTQKAFYYVRILEIPTPRWTTYDAIFYGTELPGNVPAIHQERAYTSPIWYTPKATK